VRRETDPPLTADRSPLTVVIAGGGTGGHLMPALAIAEAIRRRHPDWRVLLVGASRGVEAALLPSRSFPYELLPAEPIYRRQWWKNLRWPMVGLRLVRAVDRLLDRERPALVVGTGGYASGPVVWRAAGRGIPTAVQEQNAYPGLSTRLLVRRVREVWLGVPEARRYLRPGSHTEVMDTGNPITPPDPSRRDGALARFGLDPGKPVLLVTGGSQGSRAINRAVAEWIDGGTGKTGGTGSGLQVVWAAGKATYPEFRRYHDPPRVQVFDFLDPMADAYAVASLAISRAGMMTIAELCAWGIPSVLIPLPTAAADHQTPNAAVMAEAGAAVHLPQSGLSPAGLAPILSGLLDSPARLEEMARSARARARPDAVERISDRIGFLSG
jgi:UDP-N-acetylglucosamine--N-acetylmuramyl-(pentapeptide) pyrophosphoryl-undecaprenol N-acetylglucosamine transferase